MPAMSGSSSPGRRGVFVRCTLAFARRSSLCFRYSWRARSLLRFSRVGRVRLAIRASLGLAANSSVQQNNERRAELAPPVVPTWTSWEAQVVHTGWMMLNKTARLLTALPALALVLATVVMAAELPAPAASQAPRRVLTTRHAGAPALKCGNLIAFQVLLDRQ